MDITSERLAYWFLRLNGFLTIYNFVVHPDEPDERGRYQQRTDVDVMGIRFHHRKENRVRPMKDLELFERDTTQFVLAEAKLGTCRLNASWRDAKRENMQKVLSAAGVVAPGDVEAAADGLYREGQWHEDRLWVRWLCFGASENEQLRDELPAVPQLLWSRDVLPFVHARFREYRLEKSAHLQWDADAKGLYSAAQSLDKDEYVQRVNVLEGGAG